MRERTNFAAWPFGLIFGPLHALFGTVGAWNAFVLLTYAGSGAFTALWLRSLGVGAAPSVAGGLVFALAPYRVAQTAAGHLLAPLSMLLPLSLWALETQRAWLALVALASIPLSGQVHLALAAIPFFVAYVFARRGRTRSSLVVAGSSSAAAITAGLLVYVLSIRGSVGAGGRSFAQVERYSAEPFDFVSRSIRDGIESFVFLGWLTPLLAIAGAIAVARRDRRLAAILAAGAILPIVLALGSNTPLYEPLWRIVPGLGHTRVPERLMPIACLALAALAALALARVRWRWLALAALPILALDLRVAGIYKPHGADEGNRIYAALRAAPPGRYIERPTHLPDSVKGSVYQYYAMQAQRERPTGYSTVAPLEADAVVRKLRLHSVEPRDLGVRYLVTFRNGPAGLRRLPE